MNFLALKLTATRVSYLVSDILIQAYIFAINLVNFLALKLTATCDSYWVSKILIQAHAFAINLVHFLALKLTATRVSYLVSAPKLAATCFGKFLAPKSTATCNGYYYSILISVTLCPKTCNTLTQDTSGTLHWFYGEFLWGSKMKRMPCQLPNLLKSYPMIS